MLGQGISGLFSFFLKDFVLGSYIYLCHRLADRHDLASYFGRFFFLSAGFIFFYFIRFWPTKL